MSGGTNTTTSTTGIQNKDVNDLLSKLAKGISGEFTPGSSAYIPPGSVTTGSWQDMLDASGNPDYMAALEGAIGSYGSRAAGGELGIDDPLYAAQRARLTDDVKSSVGSAFNNSGMWGSDDNIETLTRELTGSLGALDTAQRTESYGRQAEAAGMLPDLFNSYLLPSTVASGVGGSMDADAAAAANGEIDYYRKFTELLGGVAGMSPQTTTNKTPTPNPLLGLLGLGLSFI